MGGDRRAGAAPDLVERVVGGREVVGQVAADRPVPLGGAVLVGGCEIGSGQAVEVGRWEPDRWLGEAEREPYVVAEPVRHRDPQRGHELRRARARRHHRRVADELAEIHDPAGAQVRPQRLDEHPAGSGEVERAARRVGEDGGLGGAEQRGGRVAEGVLRARGRHGPGPLRGAGPGDDGALRPDERPAGAFGPPRPEGPGARRRVDHRGVGVGEPEDPGRPGAAGAHRPVGFQHDDVVAAPDQRVRRRESDDPGADDGDLHGSLPESEFRVHPDVLAAQSGARSTS